jgi:hypothetical protein
MKAVMVRYKIKPGRMAENEKYIKQVFEQLEREKPAGLRYASFKLEDGVSFVHIASHEGNGRSPLAELAAFKAFTATIKERCEDAPVATELKEVGSYRSLAG